MQKKGEASSVEKIEERLDELDLGYDALGPVESICVRAEGPNKVIIYDEHAEYTNTPEEILLRLKEVRRGVALEDFWGLFRQTTTADEFWHFSAGINGNGDGRPIPVGRWQRMKRHPRYVLAPVLYEAGMHASRQAIDALHWAPGGVVSICHLRGDVIHGDDESVGRWRRVIAQADATNVLHRFAIWCAAKALRAARVTDRRCWEALRTKSRWLVGRATDKELRSALVAAQYAWSAARDARDAVRQDARDAAWHAVRAAWNAAWHAWDTAWSEARFAAWESARAAAWSDARADVRYAVRSDAWDELNAELERRLRKLLSTDILSGQNKFQP